MKISSIHARQILDSRGYPTIETDIVLEDGSVGRASVPSGASTGSHEAIELRDNNLSEYEGKSVEKAIFAVNETIAQDLKTRDLDQHSLDQAMILLDGTPNKASLGANAILSVSLAFAHASAVSQKQPLFSYFQNLSQAPSPLLPLPMINIINGGKHAAHSTDIQEFLVLPVGASSFSDALEMGANIFHSLGEILTKKGYDTTVGDEGGYAPHVENGNHEALDLIIEAIKKAGYEPEKDVVLGLDIAASELYSNGNYELRTENRELSTEAMMNWLKDLSEKYPIASIEDGLSEDDFEGWKKLTALIGERTQIVGDDLFATDPKRITTGIAEQQANAVLIKLNQVGTVTETLKAVSMAKEAGWRSIISHRSGETEDTTISHLAVGLATGQIKTGSLSRSERIGKYNELLRIEEELGNNAVFAGRNILKLGS